MQAWQEQRTKAQVMEEAAAQEAAQKAKGWSLEDDLDEVSLQWFFHLPIWSHDVFHVSTIHLSLLETCADGCCLLFAGGHSSWRRRAHR